MEPTDSTDLHPKAADRATARQATPERLFDAAIAEFARHGYQGATVRGICQRAGANVAAVNYHFGGKEQLYARVLEHIFRTPREARAALRPDMEGAPPAERLREFIHNFFHEVYDCVDDRSQCGDLASIFIMEMAHPSPALGDIIDKYIQPDSQRLAEIVAELLGPDAAPQLVRYATGAVVAQVLHFCNIGPIIARLAPDSLPVSGQLDALAGLAAEFTLGGLERLARLGQPQPPNPHS